MFGLISYWLIWFEQSIGNIKRPDLNTYKDIDGIDNRNLYDVFKIDIDTPKKDGFNYTWPGNIYFYVNSKLNWYGTFITYFMYISWVVS